MTFVPSEPPPAIGYQQQQQSSMFPPQRPVFGGGQGPADMGQAYMYVYISILK